MGRITELYGFIYSFNSFTKVLVGCYFCCWQVRIIYLLAKCRGGGSDKNTTSLLFLQERSSLNNPRKSLSLYDCSKILFSVNSSLFQSKSIAWDEAHVRTEMFLDLRKSGSNSGGVMWTEHLSQKAWRDPPGKRNVPDDLPSQCVESILVQSPPQNFKIGQFWLFVGWLDKYLGHVWGIIWGMSGASSGACLGHHLRHVWGMSGACLRHVWDSHRHAIDSHRHAIVWLLSSLVVR